MKAAAIILPLALMLVIPGPAFSQGEQGEVDSLMVLFKASGRNWDEISDQLIRIGEPAVFPLVNLLLDTTQSQWNRRIAAMTLNQMHSTAYIGPALHVLMDGNESLMLRNQVCQGLKGLDLSHVTIQLQRIFREERDIWFRLNVAEILLTSDPEIASTAFRELYDSSDGYVKQKALQNLILLNPEESFDLYFEALQDEDWMTSNLAMDSLSSSGNFQPARIIRLYYRPETSETVRWRIVHVLSRRPEAEYLYLLVEALSDPGWLVHQEAALALSRIPAAQVLPELRLYEQSEDPELDGRAAWVKERLRRESPGELASMQPFEGYPMLKDMDKITEVLRNKCVDTISFRKGEIVADIGAGNGYLEAMLSMFHDDLTFYIQDIDPSVCNPEAVRRVMDFYQEVHGRPFTSSFTTVIGTDTETRLPDNTFDRILMLWTYQYLKEPDEFIRDVREKMKNDGLLYVINPEQDYDYAPTLRARYGWNASTVDKQISDIISCGFELVRIARNYHYVELPYVMVFRKSQ